MSEGCDFPSHLFEREAMPYIHPKNRDTRYPLWFVRYQCRVPYIQTLSIEDLEQNGLPTSGDAHHDHAMQWEPRLISIPIHRMADLWHSGANIALVNRKDAPKIYEAISAHLFAWRHHIEHSYHPVAPPADDLLVLDQFANIVYEHAKFAYDPKFVETHFKMASRNTVSRRAMLTTMLQVEDNRRTRAEKGDMQTRNIEYVEIQPAYDPNATFDPVDYSGKDVEYNAPTRNSMAKFFKKGIGNGHS